MKSFKRIFAILFAVFMIMSLGSTVLADDENISLSEIYRDHTGRTMIASRKGDFANSPENSLSAIKSAVDNGTDIVEIDIKMTADGVLILMEDDTVTRTCYGYGENTAVSEMTYNEIKDFKLLSGQGGHGAKETDETVPSLEEVFENKLDCLYMLDADWALRDEIYKLCEKYDMLGSIIFYIDDAKTQEIAEWKASLDTAPMIMTYFKGNVIFTATSRVKSASEVSDCIQLATKNPYGVVFGETVQNKASNCSIRTMASPCTPEICGKIMQDTSEWWDYLISCGFSIIMTDNVAGLREYLDKCENEKEVLGEVYKSTVTDWTLPNFATDNYHDYKLAYTNAKTAADEIFADGSSAYSDIEQAVYELKKSYNDINAHYEEFENGTAGMTVTPLRIFLSAMAIAAVTCAEIYVYKKKKKS